MWCWRCWPSIAAEADETRIFRGGAFRRGARRRQMIAAVVNAVVVVLGGLIGSWRAWESV